MCHNIYHNHSKRPFNLIIEKSGERLNIIITGVYVYLIDFYSGSMTIEIFAFFIFKCTIFLCPDFKKVHSLFMPNFYLKKKHKKTVQFFKILLDF